MTCNLQILLIPFGGGGNVVETHNHASHKSQLFFLQNLYLLLCQAHIEFDAVCA